MKYALWNNKGGVGKTFLTFAIATGVAEQLLRKNDKRKVVIVDLCPQANISEILLGGNSKGPEALEDLIQQERTIAGYFQSRMNNSVHEKIGSEYFYVCDNETIHKHNSNIPENMLLVAGDPAIELQSGSIRSYANHEIPAEAWRNVHLWVDDLIKTVEKQSANPIFFIDCNPSFSIYTELALVAADRLIVPCSPDGSSIRAVHNTARLIYGEGIIDNRYGEMMHFYNKIKRNNMQYPKLHLFISNRATLYEKPGSKLAKAYGNLQKKLKTKVDELYKKRSDLFSATKLSNLLIETMPDHHSIGIIMASSGTPLGKIQLGYHETGVQINQAQKDKYQKFLDTTISKLDLF